MGYGTRSFRRSILSAFFATLLLTGCGGGGGGGGGSGGGLPKGRDALSPPEVTSIGASATGNASDVFIGPQATLEIPGRIKVTLPASSVPPSTIVTVSLTNDRAAASSLEIEAELAGGLKGRQPFEYRINLGINQPADTIYPVVITLPSDFLAAKTANDAIGVFARLETEGITYFEAIPSVFDSVAGTLSVNLPSVYFGKSATADQSYETLLVVALKTVPQPRLPSGEKVAGYTFDHVTGMNNPLKDPYILISKFSPYRELTAGAHKGIDMAVIEGTPVYAAADGICKTRAQRLDNSDPNSPLDPTGFGYLCFINHPDDSTTVYAHLREEGTKGAVRKGQRIAFSGQTGGADPANGPGHGPHLHFEVIPNSGAPTFAIDKDLTRENGALLLPDVTHVSNDPAKPTGFIALANNTTAQLYALDATGPTANHLNVINVDSNGDEISLPNLKWELAPNTDPGLLSIDKDTGVVTTFNKLGKATVQAKQSFSPTNIATAEITVGNPLDFSITEGELFTSSYIYSYYVGNFAGLDCEWQGPGFWGTIYRPGCTYAPWGYAPPVGGNYTLSLIVRPSGGTEVLTTITKQFTVYPGPGLVWSNVSCEDRQFIDPISQSTMHDFESTFSGPGYITPGGVVSPSLTSKIDSCGSWTTFTENGLTKCRRDPGQPVESIISGTDSQIFYASSDLFISLYFNLSPSIFRQGILCTVKPPPLQ